MTDGLLGGGHVPSLLKVDDVADLFLLPTDPVRDDFIQPLDEVPDRADDEHHQEEPEGAL